MRTRYTIQRETDGARAALLVTRATLAPERYRDVDHYGTNGTVRVIAVAEASRTLRLWHWLAQTDADGYTLTRERF